MTTESQPTVLYCPFPPQAHPEVAALATATLDWATRFALLQSPAAIKRFERARYHWLAARVCPDAPLEPTILVSGWFVWLFLLDDHCDESGLGSDPVALRALLDGYLAQLRDPEGVALDGGPLAASLRDLWRRSTALMDAGWRARFRHDLAAYFAGAVWEAANRAADRYPTVPEFLAMRHVTGAFLPALDMTEIAYQLALPEEIRTMPLIQRLTSTAGNVVCWSNDVISLAKERAQGDRHNLVLTLRRERHLTMSRALAAAARLHDLEVRQFEALAPLVAEARPRPSAPTRRYLAILRAWMRGNLDWGQDSGRYTVPTAAERAAHVEPAIVGAARRA